MKRDAEENEAKLQNLQTDLIKFQAEVMQGKKEIVDLKAQRDVAVAERDDLAEKEAALTVAKEEAQKQKEALDDELKNAQNVFRASSAKTRPSSVRRKKNRPKLEP